MNLKMLAAAFAIGAIFWLGIAYLIVSHINL